MTGEELYKKDGEQVGQNIDNDDNELSAPFTLFDSPRTSEVGPIKIRRDFRQLNAVFWICSNQASDVCFRFGNMQPKPGGAPIHIIDSQPLNPQMS